MLVSSTETDFSSGVLHLVGDLMFKDQHQWKFFVSVSFQTNFQNLVACILLIKARIFNDHPMFKITLHATVF